MPLTFPGHQGLILPVARKWPAYFDALALSVGAAMPDVMDSVLGFAVNGYFKQWFGHSLLGVAAFDLPGGLILTWFLAALVARYLKHGTVVHLNFARERRARFGSWGFSLIVGILSHLGFDLISHDTNLLLYPWYENLRWFPAWWYTTWFEIRVPLMFDHSYAVGVFTLIWGGLSIIGVFLFIRYLQAVKAKSAA